MKKFEDYEIQFVGLKEGKHDFDYHINRAFFDHLNYDGFHDVDVDVHLGLEKKPNMLDLSFVIDGTVNLDCDVSNEPYDQVVEGRLNLVVKFGDHYEDDYELLILPNGAHKLEVQHYIYEAIILAVPYKKVHPKVIDGTMESKILDKLEELSPGINKTEENEKIDPRWNKLKELLNEN